MSNSLIHGDVDLIPAKLPENAKKQKIGGHPRGTAIELGEHTGHAHVIAPTLGGYLNIYLDEDLTQYIEVDGAPAVITHEEHCPLIIPIGVYRKAIETEYDPFKKVIKKVVD